MNDKEYLLSKGWILNSNNKWDHSMVWSLNSLDLEEALNIEQENFLFKNGWVKIQSAPQWAHKNMAGDSFSNIEIPLLIQEKWTEKQKPQ